VQGKRVPLMQLMDEITNAAWQAARVIQAGAEDRVALVWETKGTADFVSEIDRNAEQAIADWLLSVYPEARIIGEELSPDDVVLGGLAFIVDPVDGTTNYLHGYPEYAVSIGAYDGGNALAGLILNVATRDLYTATRGGGAMRNGEPLRVSGITDPSLSLIGTGFPFKHLEYIDRYMGQFETVMRGSSGVRRAGSAALDLATVAAGQFDGFWELGLAPWDVAAGLILVREAGGVVTDFEGNEVLPTHGPYCAGNPAIHEWLLRAIHDSDKRLDLAQRGHNSSINKKAR
jgi:myo-inositol-1(or 4)-monophosphatase